MIIKLKKREAHYPDLSPGIPYFVIGIEADDYRILNNQGKPYLYPSEIFDLVDSKEPASWVTERGESGERYSYPKELRQPGFFEDYFDGKPEAFSRFWHVINAELSKAA